jgi:hypothetical protein
MAPLARDGSGKSCHDCASADGLMAYSKKGLDFLMARIAVGNDRQEQYRLPGISMGLVAEGLMRASKEGDFQRHLAWLDEHRWFGIGADENDP